MSGLRRVRQTYYTEKFEGKPSKTPSKTQSSPRKRKPKSSADKVPAKISKAETPPKSSDVKKGEIENVSTADTHGDKFEETEIEKITENNDKSDEKCDEIHDLHVEDGTQSDDCDMDDPNRVLKCDVTLSWQGYFAFQINALAHSVCSRRCCFGFCCHCFTCLKSYL